MKLRSMLRRKKSWLDRARDFLDDWRDGDADFADDDSADDDFDGDEYDDEDTQAFSGLHWMTAGLFVAAGLEAAVGERRGDYRSPGSLRWAPLIAGPAAATAHALRAARPSRATRLAAQILDGVAIGVGTVGVASSLHSALRADEADSASPWPAQLPSAAPLAFCAVGLLAVLLEDEEKAYQAERARLERRARIVGRLVPERKARVDRIVIHA